MKLNYTWLPADHPDSIFSIQISKAMGSELLTTDQEQIYDGISSWWCKPLGHAHPLVINSIQEQLKHFEHHIPAKAWNETIETLSSTLVNIFTTMDKVIYASDGSSAIEIAMKLSYECRVLSGQLHRSKFIALANGYHGETLFALSVCGIDEYKQNFSKLLQQNYFIDKITYVDGKDDPLWDDCKFETIYWDEYFKTIAPMTTALIFEPIVQGAAGMKIISRDFIYKLANVARKYGLHIIADEIMVGLGRIGVLSVSKELIGLEPDIVCFAKNLTAGSIPMSAVVVNKNICNIYRKYNKAFYHSHTHSCNTLAARVAGNYIDYLKTSSILEDVVIAEKVLQNMFNKFKQQFNFIESINVIGSIASMTIDSTIIKKHSILEIGLKNSIYLRNIGNIIYIMPPLYNICSELPLIEKYLFAVLKLLNNQ